MTKRIILSILFFLTAIGFSQGQQILDYPDGLYKTKQDFLNRKPSEVRQLDVEKIALINDTDSVIRRCFFLYKETGKRIKNIFSVVYRGDLYFSNMAILKNKNKEDKSLSPVSSMNSFVLVTLWGNKYLYAEAGLVNHWQVGISNGVASGVGGFVGSELGKAIDNSYPSTTLYGTGLVWDLDKNEFNIFRNCPDFNQFIENYPVEKIDCEKEIFDLNRVRDIIENINNLN